MTSLGPPPSGITIDPALYTEQPYNGLATSSEIILNQIKELGVDLDGGDPQGGGSDIVNGVAPLTAEESQQLDIGQPDDRENAIRILAPRPSRPLIRDPSRVYLGMSSANAPATGGEPGTWTDRRVYDGPSRTDSSFGNVLNSYGMPQSFRELFTDAEEAFIGIVSDLNKAGGSGQEMSLADIFTKNDRMRGLGALFIVIALVGIILQTLMVQK
jgi:hypothetical protein